MEWNEFDRNFVCKLFLWCTLVVHMCVCDECSVVVVCATVTSCGICKKAKVSSANTEYSTPTTIWANSRIVVEYSWVEHSGAEHGWTKHGGVTKDWWNEYWWNQQWIQGICTKHSCIERCLVGFIGRTVFVYSSKWNLRTEGITHFIQIPKLWFHLIRNFCESNVWRGLRKLYSKVLTRYIWDSAQHQWQLTPTLLLLTLLLLTLPLTPTVFLNIKVGIPCTTVQLRMVSNISQISLRLLFTQLRKLFKNLWPLHLYSKFW